MCALTGIRTIGHHQHTQGAQVDVPLVPVGYQSPVHVPGLHAGYLGCRGRSTHTHTHRKFAFNLFDGEWSELTERSDRCVCVCLTFVLADFLDPRQRVDLHQRVGHTDHVHHVHHALHDTHITARLTPTWASSFFYCNTQTNLPSVIQTLYTLIGFKKHLLC